ncbi:hypothetical protein SAMN02927900_05881 [Rhizobium mongolense subsp. loessense]|uniref:Uncharacterized protein n=1 Tax=Rhizobium mongolense subsp. loessense TaxID=158890 RepID=A0A1G4TZN4_9HYPH|nr:hypothetical protein SAMN02927900_05881 [Rhizobium mongolense subsp. loessense]
MVDDGAVLRIDPPFHYLSAISFGYLSACNIFFRDRVFKIFDPNILAGPCYGRADQLAPKSHSMGIVSKPYAKLWSAGFQRM